MAAVIARSDPFRATAKAAGYTVLVRSILSQQISTAAAKTICGRLEDELGTKKFQAAAIAELDADRLQALGISRQKRTYLVDLTERVLDGRLNFRRLSRADDETAISELVAVKGIGRWTAQMFLMFSLKRPDIFAPDDLGLQKAVTSLYGFSERIQASELSDFALRWKPYRTIAAWYLWRSLELEQ